MERNAGDPDGPSSAQPERSVARATGSLWPTSALTVNLWLLLNYATMVAGLFWMGSIQGTSVRTRVVLGLFGFLTLVYALTICSDIYDRLYRTASMEIRGFRFIWLFTLAAVILAYKAQLGFTEDERGMTVLLILGPTIWHLITARESLREGEVRSYWHADKWVDRKCGGEDADWLRRRMDEYMSLDGELIRCDAHDVSSAKNALTRDIEERLASMGVSAPPNPISAYENDRMLRARTAKEEGEKREKRKKSGESASSTSGSWPRDIPLGSYPEALGDLGSAPDSSSGRDPSWM